MSNSNGTQLDEKQTALLDEFRSLMFENSEAPLTQREKQFCSDACLLRYLRAREWNMSKSHKMLLDSLKWRREYKPEEIEGEKLSLEASTGKMFRRGFDSIGRPAIYMTPSRENSTDYVKNVQLLVYTIEQAIASMGENVEQMVWVIDFGEYSNRHATPLSVAREILDILSNQYPERLGAALLISAPFIFSVFFTAVKPFIHPVTRQKIHFVGKSNQEQVDSLSKFFDITTVEKRFSGTSDFEFNANVFWPAELEFERERKAKLAPSEL